MYVKNNVLINEFYTIFYIVWLNDHWCFSLRFKIYVIKFSITIFNIIIHNNINEVQTNTDQLQI